MISINELDEYDIMLAELNFIEHIFDLEDIPIGKSISELIDLCELNETDIPSIYSERTEYEFCAWVNCHEQINLNRNISGKKLSDLIITFGDIQSIPYDEILTTPEWRKRRIQIINRDNAWCIKCGPQRPVQLHVHHRYYIKNNLPWEYGDDALVTLCKTCHSELHKNTKVSVYFLINGKLEELDYTPCTRCDGVGWIERYRHVRGGLCFRCYGKKYEQLIDMNTSDLFDPPKRIPF